MHRQVDLWNWHRSYSPRLRSLRWHLFSKTNQLSINYLAQFLMGVGALIPGMPLLLVHLIRLRFPYLIIFFSLTKMSSLVSPTEGVEVFVCFYRHIF